MTGLKTHRMNHIFRENGKSLIFAMDHAAMFGMMAGFENPGQVIRQVRQGGADAILTSYGVSKQFAAEIGGMGLILRVDGGVSSLAQERGPMQLIYSVTDALRLGADAVGCMGMPGSRFESQMLPYLSDVVAQAAAWGVPVMAEMLPGGFENPSEFWTAKNIGHACRIGAELGVDFIKTTYSGDVAEYRHILENVYIPVVVLGGAKSDDPRDLLDVVYGAVQAGASGVAVGRNICQHAEPARITAAIAAIIHEGATVDTAIHYLG